MNETSTLRIGDGSGTYATQVSGSDIIVTVGEGKVTLRNAADLSFKIEGTPGDNTSDTTPADRHIILSQGGDTYRNNRDDVTIEAVDGNDYCIANNGKAVKISGANGKDSISNTGTTVIINGNDGDDVIFNEGTNAAVEGGAGNDKIENTGSRTKISAGNDNDIIYNGSASVTVNGNEGDDSISNEGIKSGISGGKGSDTISNHSENVTIYSGEDDDLIFNDANNVFINTGMGNDIISLASGGAGSYIRYTTGEGNDTIWGLSANSTLRLDGTDTYSTQASGDDVIIHVGANTITLKNFRDDPENIIIGASGTSGGGSDGGSGEGSGGGNGTDIFIGGRTQGADYFLNASSTDVLHLNDSTLSDIVATAEENGTIGIAFNTGNVIAVQSSEALSAAVMLADGSAYRYNHATRNWQSA